MKTKSRKTIPVAETPQAPLRVLVMSHMDPRVSNGGAEIAGFQMFETLRNTPGVVAWFMAAMPKEGNERLGVRITQPFGPDNYAYVGHSFDHFIHSNPDTEFPPEFMELLGRLQPDIVHLHHYTNFGVEVLSVIRRALPQARIVLTLHEYLAICNHFGQMVKRPDLRLCSRASPLDCRRCFPERSEQEFFLRELFIKRFFREVDAFVAPSSFLRDRYAAWGLPAERIVVIENGVAEETAPPLPPLDGTIVFGFFGQISRLKGIDVLFDAADVLAEMKVTGISLEIHGDSANQPEALRRDFDARLSAAPRNLRFHGPYDNWRVSSLMAAVHAVILPSIWWENSPLVIQEALRSRRPVICSDIGGMAEKVRDGLDGLHFRAGDGRSLALLLAALAAEPKRLAALQNTLATPASLASTVAANLALYAALPERSQQKHISMAGAT